MPRRLWIIAKKDKVKPADIDSAVLNGCAEVANGIPPALRDIISEGQLPIAYEEPPDPPLPEPEPPRSTHFVRIEGFSPAEEKPLNVKRTWNGKDYYFDCYATQTLKDEYMAGNVAIGDWIIVHFDDSDREVAMLKIYKSWG